MKNKINEQPILNFNFSNGVGNNIFQYMFGHLVCNQTNYQFSHQALPVLNIEENYIKREKNCKKYIRYELTGDSHDEMVDIMNKQFSKGFYVDIKGYPEDFTLYTPYRDYLKSKFGKIDVFNKDDLVLHLRAGDRLLMKGCYHNGNPIIMSEYEEGLSKFKFKKLHIVTDMPVWKELNASELESMIFHRPVSDKDRVDINTSVEYWNTMYEFFSSYDPIVRAGNTVKKDFNYMRTFDNIMFAHGTLAWWAAFLSNASNVGVYGRWRGGKDINLGWTDLPGWFQWGRKTAPSRFIKERNLKLCAKNRNHKIFVETGTKGAATILGLEKYFDKIYSVELLNIYFKRALNKINECNLQHKVHLYNGDSAQELKKILPEIKEPALFWLDAHADKNATPILQELDLVLNTTLKHTIVIDDCRYFGTQAAYPTIEEVINKVKMYQPNAEIDTKFDSIRIFLK